MFQIVNKNIGKLVPQSFLEKYIGKEFGPLAKFNAFESLDVALAAADLLNSKFSLTSNFTVHLSERFSESDLSIEYNGIGNPVFVSGDAVIDERLFLGYLQWIDLERWNGRAIWRYRHYDSTRSVSHASLRLIRLRSYISHK
jgi:hypothetical protein